MTYKTYMTYMTYTTYKRENNNNNNIKNIKTMKKEIRNLFLFAAVAATAALSACTESDVLVDESNTAVTRSSMIGFGLAEPENSTRASYTAAASFQAGDAMAVYAYQDGEDRLFNDQQVTLGADGAWTYSPVKYWQAGSTYVFYAFYPYALGHTFGTADEPYFTVPTFTVADAKDDQTDVMIAKKNTTRPFNTVDYVFNHILSNVNFYFTVADAFDMTGISSVSVKSFDMTGVYSTGAYTQTGFTSGSSAVGVWSEQSGTYDFPEVTTGTVTREATTYTLNPETGETTVSGGTSRCTLADDLLLLPQTIADDARLRIAYTLNYADGSQTTFSKAVRLASIVGTSAKSGSEVLSTWKPNVRYNYTMAVNPSVTNVVNDASDWDGTDGGGDNVGTGSIVVEGDGTYWIDADGDGAGDYPIVFEDVDGDGWLEGGVDMDGDGHIDDVDKDGDKVSDGIHTGDTEKDPTDGTQTPGNEGKDVILIDTDGDGVPDTQFVLPGSSNADDVVDNGYGIDYDGTIGGDLVPSSTLSSLPADDADNPYNDPNSPYYQDDNTDTFYFVDIDGDGEYDPEDYPVVWVDIDGDDKLEGIVDVNLDGEVGPEDNFDGDKTGLDTDSDAVNNPNGYDVIMVDRDGDGVAETQLERDPQSSNPEENTENTVIEFTATVEDWEDEYNN